MYLLNYLLLFMLLAERVMKEQEHHQIKPPGGEAELHEAEGLGHQKLGQEMIGLVGYDLGS